MHVTDGWGRRVQHSAEIEVKNGLGQIEPVAIYNGEIGFKSSFYVLTHKETSSAKDGRFIERTLLFMYNSNLSATPKVKSWVGYGTALTPKLRRLSRNCPLGACCNCNPRKSAGRGRALNTLPACTPACIKYRLAVSSLQVFPLGMKLCLPCGSLGS